MLKLSGEAFLGVRRAGIDPAFTSSIAAEIADAHALGVELGITIGGGNFFRGVSAAEHGMDRATGDAIGMLATVMNALALQNALQKLSLSVHVQSAIHMNQIAEPYVRRHALAALEEGHVVIFAAGTGDSHFTTDMAAVLRALQMNCEVVLKGTNVDAVYTKDPKKHGDAAPLRTLSLLDAVKDPHITVFDNSALALCADHSLPIVVFNITRHGALAAVLRGEPLGTIIR